MSAALAAVLTMLVLGAGALVVTLRRNRALRRRPSNVRAFMRHTDRERWLSGHGVWVNDVFAFRRSPAGWNETILWVTSASARTATEEERSRLRRIEGHPAIATFMLASGGSVAFACHAEDRAELLGPFA